MRKYRRLPHVLLALALMVPLACAQPLTRVEDVRRLLRAEAGARLPVKLRGVVTMAFPGDYGGFILDDGAYGIFVNRSHPPGGGADMAGVLEIGTLLEVEGTTTDVGFARDVVAAVIRRMGKAPLPEAKPARMDDLLGGHLDCQRVKVPGVVQYWDRRSSAPSLRLMLATPGGRKLPVLLMEVSEKDVQALVDAEVEATGVATTFFNERGELIGVNVQVHDLASLKALEPPRGKADLPLLPLASLRPFSPEPPSLHRVKVQGTVSFAGEESYFYVQDGERAVRVNTREDPRVVPGDRVEIVGYPEMRNYFAELVGAEVTRIGKAAIPPPLRSSRAQILRRWQPTESPGGLDGKRIELEARLDKIEAISETERRLYLTHEGSTVWGTLFRKKEEADELQPGSRICVTGICVVELSTSWPGTNWAVPGDFHLLVQSQDDVKVIEDPPWWTPQRIWAALAMAASSAGAATVWVVVLRRQVLAQTETIRMQSVRETLAEERSRMAREFHDTLEQELTGISIQLDAAADSLPSHPAQAVHALESALTLLDYTRTEARRSIWDLRATALQERGLFGALQWSAGQLSGGGNPELKMHCGGEPRRLGARVETHLLRIGTECLTNAVKHSRATKVDLELRFDETETGLRVKDDGIGFEVLSADGSMSGHFGIQGMRERANQIAATFRIESSPGEGTEVIVKVPLNPND